MTGWRENRADPGRRLARVTLGDGRCGPVSGGCPGLRAVISAAGPAVTGSFPGRAFRVCRPGASGTFPVQEFRPLARQGPSRAARVVISGGGVVMATPGPGPAGQLGRGTARATFLPGALACPAGGNSDLAVRRVT